MSRLPEVLAPAGNPAALEAAVLCGADAVYLGAGAFNARRGAENFTLEHLADTVRRCHIRGVRVYPVSYTQLDVYKRQLPAPA